MKNMKIAVTADQPLDEIVRELDRLGFLRDLDCYEPNLLFGVVVFSMGRSFNACDERSFNLHILSDHNLTTLAELKEM